MKTKNILKELGTFAFCLSGAFLIAAVVLSLFPLQQVSAKDKIDICHWTEAGKYVTNNVDVSSVDKWLSQGHGLHENDIWPDFTTEDGHSVAGQGDISILNNGCKVPGAPTDTSVLPTSTETIHLPTLTNTPAPPTPTGTYVPPTPTNTPIPPTATLIPSPVVPPATGSNEIYPVTGVDLGAFSRRLPIAFVNLCLGFLGVGLVLHGIARRHDE